MYSVLHVQCTIPDYNHMYRYLTQLRYMYNSRVCIHVHYTQYVYTRIIVTVGAAHTELLDNLHTVIVA